MKMYYYKGCGSCQKAVKWLEANDLSVELVPIRETPPSIDELRSMLAFQNAELKRLFNVSGMDYRQMNLKDTLPSLSETAALHLLSENGNLVKRPFLLSDTFGLVGFKQCEWAETFGK